MPDLDPTLHELAEAFGIATEYWDWQGRHVSGDPGHDRRGAGRARRRRLHARGGGRGARGAAARPWTQMLPPCLALREQRTASVWVHVPHGDPVEIWIELETGERRGRSAAAGELDPAAGDRRPAGSGEASFEIPADLPLGLPHAARPLRRADATMPLIITPAWLGLPGPDGGPPRLGAGRAALQRPLAAVLGRRRPHRPGGSGGLVGRRAPAPTSSWSIRCTPPSRGRRWSPRPTCRPAGASPTRSICGWSAFPSTPLLDGQQRGKIDRLRVELEGPAGPVDRDRPEPVLEGEAQGAEGHLLGAAYAGPGGVARRLPQPGGARVCTTSPPGRRCPSSYGPRFARLAGRAAGSAVARGGRLRGGARGPGRLPVLAAVAAGRAAGVGPPGRRCGPGWRSGVMHDLAVGVSPHGADAWGLQDTYAAGITVGAPPDPYNQNGQDWNQPPWRPGPAGRDRVRAVPGDGLDHPAARRRDPGRPRDRAVPAVVDPAGRRADRGHLRPLRPRGDDRHPRPGGAPGRGAGGRGGPGHGGAVGPDLPAASAASSARRSCGSSSTGTATGRRWPRSGGGSTAWPR